MNKIMITRTLRIMAKDNTLPIKCWATIHYTNDNKVCDCINVCKYNPPLGGIQNNIKEKEFVYYEEKIYA